MTLIETVPGPAQRALRAPGVRMACLALLVAAVACADLFAGRGVTPEGVREVRRGGGGPRPPALGGPLRVGRLGGWGVSAGGR
ncbi:hypothetical protein ACFWJY_37935, partial [Streptomyces anulatus]